MASSSDEKNKQDQKGQKKREEKGSELRKGWANRGSRLNI
jgi:hypothetical protein